MNLFKYISDDDDILKSYFEDNEIRLSQPAVLNDPLECNPDIKYSDEAREVFYAYNEYLIPSFKELVLNDIIENTDIINRICILSLTTQAANYDMWNHYCNGHKGLVVEFNDKIFYYLKKNSEKNIDILNKTRKVTYENNILKDFPANITDEYFINNFLLKKSNHWEYEEEYRFFRYRSDGRNLTNNPNDKKTNRDYNIYVYSFDSLDCIDSITFGLSTHPKTKKYIFEQMKGYNIQYYQTFLSRKNGFDFKRIKVQDIDFIQFPDDYLTRPSSIFSRYDENMKIKTISNLNEIPYYKNPDLKKSIDILLEQYKKKYS